LLLVCCNYIVSFSKSQTKFFLLHNNFKISKVVFTKNASAFFGHYFYTFAYNQTSSDLPFSFEIFFFVFLLVGTVILFAFLNFEETLY
jgi:hypothetical protein